MRRLSDPAVRASMATNARRYTVENGIDEPFSAILDSDTYRRRVKRRKKLEKKREADGATALDGMHDFDAVEVPLESYLVHHRDGASWAAGA